VTPRGTLALVGALVLLAVYVSVIDRPATPSTSLPPPLLAIPAADVTRLEVVWPQGTVNAGRDAGGWRAERGAALPADVVGDVLAALGTVRPVSRLRLTAGDAGDYGFGPEQATVRAYAGGQRVLDLEVGARNPAWTGLYVRHRGADEVLVVGSLLYWELEKLRAATRS
jgi:hypothetical protein